MGAEARRTWVGKEMAMEIDGQDQVWWRGRRKSPRVRRMDGNDATARGWGWEDSLKKSQRLPGVKACDRSRNDQQLGYGT